MASRPYNSELRQRKQAELKARIVNAAAALHARKGARDTSYAEIAAEAGTMRWSKRGRRVCVRSR